jgi:hypothetical protein
MELDQSTINQNVMKIFYKKFLAFVLVALMSVPSVMAEKISFSAEESNQMKVTDKSFSSLQMNSKIANINFEYATTEQGLFTVVSSGNFSTTMNVGEPALPVLKKLIEIPQGATPIIEILKANVEEYTLEELGINHPIAPYQLSLPKVKDAYAPFEYKEAAYQTDAFSPSELVRVEEVGNMRAVRLGRLEVQHLQYNPVQGKVRVYTEIECRITFEGADYQATMERKQKLYSPYFTKAYAQLINYEPMQMRDEITQLPIKYVIVADPMFEQALQPFVEWKTQKGYTVVEGYTDDPNVGSTTGSIKAFLQDMYDNATTSDPAPTFVIFVGDVDQVPVFNGSGHITDLYYCEYDGDYIPEMYYGRFSANDVNELTPQVDKTLEYEKYEFPDPSFLGECTMVSGVDGSHASTYGNGQIYYGVTNYFNEDHGLSSHTFYYPESGSSSSQIIQTVSDGVAYANYTAHGNWDGWSDPSFNNSDVPGLQNEHKYPLMVGNCCLTNKFEKTSCFGETLLRAEGKGALGYIGGTNSTYWDEDYYWGVGVGAISATPTYESTTLGSYDRLFHDHGEDYSEWFTTQGQQNYAGCLTVTESGSSRTQYYWEIYALMGDPSISIYMGVPPTMNVNYDVLPVGADEFVVNAPAYSLVALSYDGDLKGTAQANASGVATIHFNDPITTAGEADIVITGQNYEPFFGTVILAGEPEAASEPHPLNTQQFVTALTALSWTDPSPVAAETFTLYLGTDNPPTNVINGMDLTEANYQPDQLDYETTYYWRVDSENEYGTVEGEVWSFTTTREPDENFETGNFSENPWVFGGDLPWTATQEEVFNGLWSARSGAIGDGQTSSIIIDVNCTVFMSTVSFYKMVSSEGPQDALEFYIDGDLKKSWGGLGGWSYEQFNITSGTHTLEWRYVKDESGSGGEDGAWIDYIYFPDPTTTTASAGGDGVVCSNNSYQLYGSATLFNSVEWTTDGDGYFDNANILTPVYTPGEMDIEAGSVVLTLSVESSMKETVSDDMTLTITPAASALAGSDSYLCSDNPEMNVLAEASAFNYTALLWTTSGDGSFDDATAMNPVYTPGTEDIAAGIVELVLSAEGDAPCGTDNDTIVMEVMSAPMNVEVPVLPAEINTASTPVTEISIEVVAGAETYEWVLEPAAAGSVTAGEAANCTIDWNTDFEGDVTLQVRAGNGCGMSEFAVSESAFVYFGTGLDEQEELRFTVYPNPGTGLFHIQVSNAQNAELNVLNILGQEVYKQTVNDLQSQLDLTNFNNGIYFIMLRSGERTEMKRIVLQK